MIYDSRFMSSKIQEFTDLNAWKESHKLILELYALLRRFPIEERFAMSSQLRRSVISITNNIAEGFGRQTYKEKLQFYYIAQGSLTETKNLILLAKDLKYINEKEYNSIQTQINLSHKILQGLISSTKKFLNHKS